MKRLAILVLTIEGVQHADGGVAGLLTNLIEIAPEIRRRHREIGVDVDFYAAEQACREDHPRYSAERFRWVDESLRALGGRAERLVSVTHGDNSVHDERSHTPRNYLVAATAGAQLALVLVGAYDGVVVISGNTLFAQAPVLLAEHTWERGGKILCVHLTHSPPVPHRDPSRRDERIEINELLAQAVRGNVSLLVGFESEYMRSSYQERFELPDRAMVDVRSGIPVNHPKFDEIPKSRIAELLRENGIPEDRPLALAWGRADADKGFDVLLQAVALLDDDLVPVIISPTSSDEIRELDQKLGTNAVLLTDKPFEIIAGVLQWDNTYVAAFLSGDEAATVTPAEAMMAARGNGCVVMAHRGCCYPETVVDGVTGALAASRDPQDVAVVLRRVLGRSLADRRALGRAAVEHVCRTQNFVTNFAGFVDNVVQRSVMESTRL